jgi:hypothetical protein
MVCKDKGLTKFPGGVKANYYKPLRYVGEINLAYASAVNLGAEPSKEFLMFCRHEFEVARWLKSIKMPPPDSEKISILGSDTKFDRDSYLIRRGGKTSYLTRLSHVFWGSYINAVRGSEFTTIAEVSGLLEELINVVKKYCTDNEIDCPDIHEGNYPKCSRF